MRNVMFIFRRVMEEEKDKLLVEGIIKGDENSFKLLFDKYHAHIYRFAIKFLKSQDLSKEIVHDVFFKIWEKRETLNSDLPIKFYLIKTCKNMSLNALQNIIRENSFKKEILQRASLVDNDTEDFIIFNDYKKFAYTAIEQLPPQRQSVYKLCKIEGKSYQEAADILGISKGTVRDHMLKASRVIKQLLSGYSYLISLFLIIL